LLVTPGTAADETDDAATDVVVVDFDEAVESFELPHAAATSAATANNAANRLVARDER
jgi:hypothetical protein